jgi:fucose permease
LSGHLSKSKSESVPGKPIGAAGISLFADETSSQNRPSPEPPTSQSSSTSFRNVLGSAFGSSTPAAAKAFSWISGFFLCGALLGLLGVLPVTWRYYIDIDSRLIGFHFLMFYGGLLGGQIGTRRRMQGRTGQVLTATASVLAGLALVGLGFALPPAPAAWRMAGLLVLGAAAGTIASGLFQLVRPFQHSRPAAALVLNGAFIGTGATFVTLLVGKSYSHVTAQMQLFILAAIPLVFVVIWWLRRPPIEAFDFVPSRARLSDLGSVAAVLFSLLLFFQFGTEWSLAAWLPLFLIRHLGCDPESAILLLSLYFVARIAGNFVMRSLLKRLNHTRLLIVCTFVAMLGYFSLTFTKSLSGAGAALIVIGAGFAPIYPLVAEKVGRRFSLHPSFYETIFMASIAGAILAPWALGYVDFYLGLNLVMVIPAFGTLAVLVLVLLIMLESKLMAEEK